MYYTSSNVVYHCINVYSTGPWSNYLANEVQAAVSLTKLFLTLTLRKKNKLERFQSHLLPGKKEKWLGGAIYGSKHYPQMSDCFKNVWKGETI